MTPDVIIRPYHPDDRSAVMKIAADTAFFGSPVEAFFDHRQTFLDGFYTYFLDREPGTCWVAQMDEVVLGFLVGSPQAARQTPYSLTHIYPKMLIGLITGRYRLGRQSWHYLSMLLGQAVRGEFVEADLEQYPANLHINVTAEARGMGIGKQLMSAYQQQLTGMGIPGVHLHTTDQNIAACAMYERLGYRLLSAKCTRAWIPLLGKEVENRCYGLKLV